MPRWTIGGLAVALAALAACGGPDDGRAGLTAEQEQDLNETAAMLDRNGTIDVAADGLTLNEADLVEEETGPAGPTANDQ